MWKTALAEHLNLIHLKAMAPEMQAVVTEQGLFRCGHCHTLYGYRNTGHEKTCGQGPDPLAREQYSAHQPTRQERGATHRAAARGHGKAVRQGRASSPLAALAPATSPALAIMALP